MKYIGNGALKIGKLLILPGQEFSEDLLTPKQLKRLKEKGKVTETIVAEKKPEPVMEAEIPSLKKVKPKPRKPRKAKK